jgi:hypothetical protein
MGSYMEIINPQLMTGILLEDGEVIARYPVERCDKCEQIRKFDEFGYQKGIAHEKLLWFCGDCR